MASAPAFAGVYEISALYNFKKTYYDSQNYEATETGTGSLAYYFWEMSALELSYTKGAAILVQPGDTVYQDISAYGADLLFTIANRESSFKPYIKVGGSYVIKTLRHYYAAGATMPAKIEGLSPFAGIGMKFMIGQQFGIKMGIDVSSSPMANNQPTTYDFGANAGISFLF